MLRVHFTADDLLDVTFANEPAPLMELGLAPANLQRDDGLEPALHGWRRGLRGDLPGAARPLVEIVPPAANGRCSWTRPSPTSSTGSGGS